MNLFDRRCAGVCSGGGGHQHPVAAHPAGLAERSAVELPSGRVLLHRSTVVLGLPARALLEENHRARELNIHFDVSGHSAESDIHFDDSGRSA